MTNQAAQAAFYVEESYGDEKAEEIQTYKV